MKGTSRVVALAVAAWATLSWHQDVLAGRVGLITRLAEINLSGMETGETYNIRQLKNMPYVVENTSETGVDIQAEVIPPLKDKIREGYEPIPDLAWVKVLPDRFHLEPGGSSFSEIIIAIPNDPKWKDRNYQAAILAKTVGTGMLAVGVKTHLYFSTGAGPAPKKEAKPISIPDFEFSPSTIRLNEVDTGRKVNVKKEFKSYFRLINKSETPFKMRFKTVGFDSNHQVPTDFEAAPSSATLTLNKESLRVKADSIQELSFHLTLPEDAHGKRYAFMVKGELEGIDIPIETYVMVLAVAKDKAVPKDEGAAKE